MVIVLGLPAARTNLEEVVGELAVVLPLGHGCQVAEGSINDSHVNLVGEKAGWNPTEGPSIDANFALQLQFGPNEFVDLLDIPFQVIWCRLAFGSAIGPIVPSEHIDALVKEHLQVVGMA